MTSIKCYVLKSGNGFVRKKLFGGYEKTLHFSSNCIFMDHEDPEEVAAQLSCTSKFPKKIEVCEFSFVESRVLA